MSECIDRNVLNHFETFSFSSVLFVKQRAEQKAREDL